MIPARGRSGPPDADTLDMNSKNPGGPKMKYLHTMVRVTDLDASIDFYTKLGLTELRRIDNEGGRFTLVFLAAEGDESAQVELLFGKCPADAICPQDISRTETR